MDYTFLQKQIQDNLEDLQNNSSALQNWEEEMKSKENELKLLKLNSDKLIDENEEIVTEKELQKLKHEEADTHKLKGNDFVKVGKWNEALVEYSKAISIYSDDAVYYGNRAYCNLQLNNCEAAEKDCTKALELKSDYAKVALRRANIRRKLGNLRGAARDYNLVLILEPKNSTALKEYEEIYPQLKEYFAELGITIPEFTESNPSAKAPQEDEFKQSVIDQAATKGKIFKSLVSKTPKERSRKKVKFTEKNYSDNSNTEKKTDLIKNGDYSEISPEKNKPPHLRSKLPLRRIQIDDIYI